MTSGNTSYTGHGVIIGHQGDEIANIHLIKNQTLSDGTHLLQLADRRGGQVLFLNGPTVKSVRLKDNDEQLLIDAGCPGYFYTRNGHPSEYFHRSRVAGRSIFKMANPDMPNQGALVELSVDRETAAEMTAYRLTQFLAKHPELTILLPDENRSILASEPLRIEAELNPSVVWSRISAALQTGAPL